MRRLTRSFTALGSNALGLLVFIALWAILALFFPAYIVPSPVDVVRAIPTFLARDIARHTALTLYRAGAGFAWAFVLGAAAGILGFLTRRTQPLNTFMVSLEVLPGTILGIIFLLLFGIGSRVPIALVAFLTLPTVAINTANALAKKNIALEQYLIATGGARSHLVRYVYLPALIPTFQSNLTIGFGLALKIVVLGEFIGSQDGIGYLLNVARVYFNMKEVFFYLLIVLLAMTLFQVALSVLFTAFLEKYFYPE